MSYKGCGCNDPVRIVNWCEAETILGTDCAGRPVDVERPMFISREEFDARVREFNILLAQAECRLLSNDKELNDLIQNMQEEIDSLKERVSTLEEKINE